MRLFLAAVLLLACAPLWAQTRRKAARVKSRSVNRGKTLPQVEEPTGAHRVAGGPDLSTLQTLARRDTSGPAFYLREPDGSERMVKMTDNSRVVRNGRHEDWRAIRQGEYVLHILIEDDGESVQSVTLMNPQMTAGMRPDSVRSRGVVQAVGLESHFIIISDGKGETRKGEVVEKTKVLLRSPGGSGDVALDWKTIREGDTVLHFDLDEDAEQFRILIISRGGQGAVRN